MNELTLHIDKLDPIEFFGVNNSKFNLMKRAFPQLKLSARGHSIKVLGNEKEIVRFKDKIASIIDMLQQKKHIGELELEEFLFTGEFADGTTDTPSSEKSDVIVHGQNGMAIKARTKNQQLLVEQSLKNDVVFAVGPAGTGKTYTAVALAVRALKEKRVKRIILTRPAVEAGESLGFLPGDLKEKIDPYLRPLYDALDDMIHFEKLRMFMESRVIEIAPLAFMRGRTLDNAFIILDEAQNATVPQLKMFLTRIGPSAKCIVTGDMTQIDLPKNQKSGLSVALDILKNVPGISVIRLTHKDVIRHKLVKSIIKAFDKYNEEQPS